MKKEDLKDINREVVELLTKLLQEKVSNDPKKAAKLIEIMLSK